MYGGVLGSGKSLLESSLSISSPPVGLSLVGLFLVGLVLLASKREMRFVH